MYCFPCVADVYLCFCSITVWLLEAARLEEDYPITKFFENKRFLICLQMDQ